MSEPATTINASPSGTTVTVDPTSAGGPSGPQGGGSPTPVAVPPNANPTDWTSALTPELKHYVTQKGFKDTSAVVDSYQNLEKLMGAPKERLLKLPEKFDSPEMNEVYDRLGRPKEAAGYAFKTPEGAQENKEFTNWAQGQFHKLGLSKSQGEALAQGWNEYAMNLVKQDKEASVKQLQTETTALKREWGAAFEQEVKSAFKAAQTFGLDEAKVGQLEKALGYSATMKFLNSIGKKVGEDNFIIGSQDGGGFRGAMTPESAKAEIEALKKDQEFIRKYSSGDKQSVDRMTYLHQMAHPEMKEDSSVW